MSKRQQRNQSAFDQGFKDSKTWPYPRWYRHPFKSAYMAGWYAGKRKHDVKRDGFIHRLLEALKRTTTPESKATKTFQQTTQLQRR